MTQDVPMRHRWATARGLKAGIESFQLTRRSDVTVLYPDVCFASLDAVADMPVTLLIESVLADWTREDNLTTPADCSTDAPFPVATLVVSRDHRSQFDPDLSNREPIEIHVWADRSVTVEVEFQGVDVTLMPPEWLQDARRVMRSWATTYRCHSIEVYNDRARSLPDIWNLRFGVGAGDRVVAELVEIGERALRTAELAMIGRGSVVDVQRLFAEGDVHAVLGWAPSVALEFWSSLPESSKEKLQLAGDVAAMANLATGGTVIVGVTGDRAGLRFSPVRVLDSVERVMRTIERHVFPVPEQVNVQFLRIGESSEGIIVVHVPAQDELMTPFLLYSAGTGSEYLTEQAFTLVERAGTETYTRSIAAVHAALVAGLGMLRWRGREPQS